MHVCNGLLMSSIEMMIVTGFGPFGDITENPSSQNLPLLRPRRNVRGISGLEVSMEAVDRFLSSQSAEEAMVHFGVNQNATAIEIESVAVNEMRFSIPDNKGVTRNGETIDSGAPLTLSTSLVDVSLLVQALALDGFPVVSSTDAGRYICNYIYYKSLQLTNQRSLFIHVPPYSVISQSDQVTAIEAILDFISS